MLRLILLLSFLTLSGPVFAQSAGTAEASAAGQSLTGEPITKERLALAEQMHDIWPIRTRVESALSSVAESFPEERRPEIKALMRRSIKYDQLEEESIKAMARIFTEDELKAMIGFYSSDAGRAVSEKTGMYEQAIAPVLTQMLDKAVLDLRTGAGPQ